MIDSTSSEEWKAFLFSTIQDYDIERDCLVLEQQKPAKESTAPLATPSRVKSRARLPKQAVDHMRDWVVREKSARPSRAVKFKMATETGITVNQISNWFHNFRKRHWRHKQCRQDQDNNRNEDYREPDFKLVSGDITDLNLI